MKHNGLNFASRGPKLVWVLTIASLAIAGGGLLLIRIFMADASLERETALNAQTQVLGVTDSFSNEITTIESGLTAMIETDRASLNPDGVAESGHVLSALLTAGLLDTASQTKLSDIHLQYQTAIAALQSSGKQLAQWHIDRDASLRQRNKAEAAVRDQIAKMRAELSTLLGASRLKRLSLLSKYRNAPAAEKLSQAESIVALGDSLATVMPLERELADMLSIVQQLVVTTETDVARDLVSNQLSQSLDRLQRAINAARSSQAGIGAFNSADFPVLLVHLLGADGRLDPDSKAIVCGTDGLLAAVDEHRRLLERAPGFRALTQAQVQHARTVLAEFVAAANYNTALRVARSNESTSHAWTSIGILTSMGAIAILALGAFIAGSIKRQARNLEDTNIELDKASALASAANSAKSAFLANMSHEIRTPMTAILGYAELLSDSSISDLEKAGHIVTIRRNGEHLIGIINDILDISKIEAGKMTLEAIDTPVIQLAEDIVTLMRPRAIAKNLFIEASLKFPLPARINSDPLRLRQVLVNLLGNAVKFTQSGSVRLQVSYANSMLRFSVIDSGIGMTLEQAEKLFQPFSQADESTSRRFGGTGLGLAISQRLVTMMGGAIKIESAAGVGTTFWFEIPIGELSEDELITHSPLQQLASETSRPAATTLAGLHVVLAEDGIDNQRLISFHLKKAGATIEVVENGKLAVDLLTRLQFSNRLPHVILMDMQMPEMDGYDATRRLRALGITTPVLALTAHAMAGDREKCIAAGCSDYLTKPIDRAHLVASIAKALPEHRAAA